MGSESLNRQKDAVCRGFNVSEGRGRNILGKVAYTNVSRPLVISVEKLCGVKRRPEDNLNRARADKKFAKRQCEYAFDAHGNNRRSGAPREIRNAAVGTRADGGASRL